MRKRWRYVAIVAGMLVAGGVAVGPVRTWQQVRAAQRALASGVLRQQGMALRNLARLKNRRADAIVLETLAGTDAMLRCQATYGIWGSHRLDLADDLRAAWQKETDPSTRSEMLCYWAQLVGPAAGPMLQGWLASQDPWTALAAARAALRLGDLRGAEVLLSMAGGQGEPAARAQNELLGLAASLAGMIGQAVPAGEARPLPPREVAQLREWWHAHVTPRLLHDYVAWRAAKPDQWNKASLLLHAWRSRFGGFLQMSRDS